MNSHDAAKRLISQPDTARWRAEANHVARANSLMSVRAGVSAGQSKRTRTPPEAATGGGSALREGGQRSDE